MLQRTTYQWKLRVPAFGIWNVGARYTLPRGSAKFDQTFAINVNNAADKDYLKVNKLPGDRRSVFFTYTLGYSGGRY